MQRNTIASLLPNVALLCVFFSASVRAEEPATKRNQYEFAEIAVPAASVDEPIRNEISVRRALDHLDSGALGLEQAAQVRYLPHERGVHGHSPRIDTERRKNRCQSYETFLSPNSARTDRPSERNSNKGRTPHKLSMWLPGSPNGTGMLPRVFRPRPTRALRLMFELQQPNGTWGSLDCWPPFESSAYHLATVALMAAATAPGWLGDPQDESVLHSVDRLKSYLRTTSPPHDYGRLLLLWASTRSPELVDADRKHELVDLIWRQQRPDGGWSIRTFAAPEAWGRGNRADKLRAEAEFDQTPSDGHLTGLAVIVLRDAGVPAQDPRIARAVQWLLENQRESGRWWTRSLNTDNWHFITFSGTCYPLLALAKCNALPDVPQTAARSER